MKYFNKQERLLYDANDSTQMGFLWVSRKTQLHPSLLMHIIS